MRSKYVEEKVGVAKIRIRQQRSCTMAVLGSFVAADKLLKNWATAMQPSAECDFEIEYLDGYTVTGRYPMRQKCTTRQSLGAYVKRAIEGVAAGGKAVAIAGMEASGFLARYEVEDFAERDGRRKAA
ncbi:hypothetical protein GCM10027277_37620 [Pseudoduganella ginsengisoli]|uniref:Uncharacterized protein n=1 Tax=Pseudoduganella ginsengisoli TaxID=1462440 RepID=A0A6L6PZ16_9BURK|nr:hypothetical protein [Pseudoduganella ginsengisoli]MTW02381.1 hypothetical protein [Pseudoduganella ginsengisoli]